jgi:hypothetical protein
LEDEISGEAHFESLKKAAAQLLAAPATVAKNILGLNGCLLIVLRIHHPGHNATLAVTFHL